jgi:hypothetical protein
MKLILLLHIFLISTAFATETTTKVENKIAQEEKQQERLIAKFNELFSEKISQGDKAALVLAKEAQKNAGKLKLSFTEMKDIMLSWDKALVKEFKKLPTTSEKTQIVKEEFLKLLKKKVNTKNDEATKLTEQGLLNGNIRLTVKQMKVYIAKWQ